MMDFKNLYVLISLVTTQEVYDGCSQLQVTEVQPKQRAIREWAFSAVASRPSGSASRTPSPAFGSAFPSPDFTLKQAFPIFDQMFTRSARLAVYQFNHWGRDFLFPSHNSWG